MSDAPVVPVVTPATISFQDFEKIDLRIGQVFAAEKIQKSTKLLKLTVNLGIETRTIVAGLGRTYEDPQILIGLHLVIVANLAPIKLMGIESHGMVLAVGEDPTALEVLVPTAPVPNGSKVG